MRASPAAAHAPMLPYLNGITPVVAISNITEAFYEFPNRAGTAEERGRMVLSAQCQGDRTLLWLGAAKLVFTSFPAPHSDYLCNHFGFCETFNLAPEKPTTSLCNDILHQPALIQKMMEYVGPQRTFFLVPYQNTPQFMRLVQALRQEYSLNVILPESPAPEAAWLRDFIDSKAGYRNFILQVLPNAAELLPEGYICQGTLQAAEAAFWFSKRQLSCVIKADKGIGRIGQTIVHPGAYPSAAVIHNKLEHNAFLKNDLLIVEQYIHSTRIFPKLPVRSEFAATPLGRGFYPSLELFVPRIADGPPRPTHIASQIYIGFSNSVVFSPALKQAPWYPGLVEMGLKVGARLQEMGYAGHFDMDTVIDDHDRLYLLEINSRRTASTHIHEFAHHTLGPNYQDETVLLAHSALKAGRAASVEQLLELTADLTFPIRGAKRGLLISVAESLKLGEFSCILVGSDLADTLLLQQELMKRLA